MSDKTLNTRLVSRHDTYTNWITVNPILLNGEIAVVTVPADTGSGLNEPSTLLKVGDGSTAFADLPWLSGIAGDVADWAKATSKPSYTINEITGLSEALENAGSKITYHTVASTDEMNAIENPVHGDVCIVKTTVTGDKAQYTAYVYDTDKWVAMDGNYSAENVYLKDDITLAGSYTSVGNINLSAGTFNVAGKSVADALKEIFTKRLQPTKTNPTLTVKGLGGIMKNSSVEVGTKHTIGCTATFKPGSYTYGPDTGVTAIEYEFTNTYSDDVVTSTTPGFDLGSTLGEGNTVTIREGTLSMSVKAKYTDGVVAVDNLGDASNPEIKITSGTTAAVNSPVITGYRNYFYGALDTSSAEEALTSDIIRSLTKANKAAAADQSFTISSHEGAKRFVVAFPKAAGRNIKEVLLTSTMNMDITTTYIKQTESVAVEGAKNYQAVDYDIYIYEPASLGADEVHKITLG